MKKCLYLLCIMFVMSLSSKAAPGDTTWVQANIAQMTYTGNYDSAVVFPNTGVTYRKILMIFTLGKYVCPGSPPPQYCGSWDYIVNNYIMTPGGDTMEISRMITPYATTSTYFPNTWTYDYVFDVTDYAALLKSNATIRVAFGGYSYGFTVNVRFAFIEGTPDRTVMGLNRLWHGQFEYGVSTDPITNHVFPVSKVVPAGTVTTDLKMRITGHGEDGNNCNEFCPNTYDVILNGNDIFTQNFFRTNCGLNPVYTQTGTWVYNRSGWCPGALVYDIYNPLPAAAGTYSVNVTFPAYTTVSSSSGNSTPTYDIEAVAVYYDSINKNLDASMDEILAPNMDPDYSRTNTVCGEPIIHVHNSGSTTITSLSINYGIVGSGGIANYLWNGSLAALQDTDIALPAIWPLEADDGLNITQQFMAKIMLVNGVIDDDQTNDSLISSFKPAPLWEDSAFVIKMKTSNVFTYPESWQILDVNNNVVASRTNTSPLTLYTDTVRLSFSCYKLVVSTPDGYGFLYGNYYSGSTGDNGYMFIYKYGSSQVTPPNYHGGDFGTGFTQYFTTSQFPAGVTTEVVGKESLETYPNPAQNIVNVDFAGMQQVNGKIRLTDALGRVVSETLCTDLHNQINVEALSNGVYTLLFIDNSHPNNRLTSRLLIAK